ncbi:hypothetical protein [Massilia sp. Se16.2.3]|uniref:hypothetical protein n=1 Tax=Massilia sp. Se16.2.3 TaxID=2709303 RepID=UPI001600D4CF|nr:hypothetical protein [Massilia sp. Se16.2.3]QNA98615.1 hypothetical protein G4G31_06860 [Massilia sp. Se16.2.3]
MAGGGWLLVPGLVYFIVWASGWYLAHDRTSPYRAAGYVICGAGAAAVAAMSLSAALEFAAGAVAHFVPIDVAQLLAWRVFPGLCAVLLLHGLGLALEQKLRRHRPIPDISRAELLEGLGHFLCAIGALAAGTLLLLAGLALLPNPAAHPILNNAIALGSFGMPLMTTLFSVTMTLMIGLIGSLYSDASREWWSRQGAWSTIFSLGWVAMFGIAFFCAPLLHWAWLTYEPIANAGTALGWLVMTWIGLKAGSGSATGSRDGNCAKREIVARLAPYFFTIGIFALLSSLVQAVVALPEVRCPAPVSLPCVYAAHANATLATDGGTLLIAFGCFPGRGAAAGLARRHQQVLALHAVPEPTGARLFRRQQRRAQAASVHRLRPGRRPAAGRHGRPAPLPHRQHGAEPGQRRRTRVADPQGRRLVRLHATLLRLRDAADAGARGDARRGIYRPTREYASKSGAGDDDATVRLGMAVALSGAAASPNMGTHSSPPLNFLMTMFNVRLGRWCPNPRKATWTHSSPGIGLFSLIAELFGMTNADANYVYLSDGGHFENLGIYELVRRRCRLVVAVDVASDKEMAFEDLGNAIRKCATDLHVSIEIDVSKMDLVKDTGLCGASCAVGAIRYSHVDPIGVDGTLLYIKPAIVGSENADVLNYRKANPAYPHQSTADQWFDEAQFESYRALGYHITKAALAGAAGASEMAGGGHDIAALCAHLMRPHGLALAESTSGRAPSSEAACGNELPL